MNENNNPSAKTALIKTFAIVGFLALIALIIWLIVQGIRVFPGAFSSLASIAETVENYRGGKTEDFTVTSKKSIVNSDEQFEVSWTDLKTDGTYEFEYNCIQGIALKVRGADGNFVSIPCTETLSLTKEAHGLFLSINSKRNQYVEVPYTVTFIDADSSKAPQKAEGSITVVNADIMNTEDENSTDSPKTEENTTSSSTATGTDSKSEVSATSTPPNTPVQPAVKPTQAKPTQVPVTYYPQSNPNGYTDLQVRFIGIGTLTDAGIFTPKANYAADVRNALRFEVKNIGTKTSAPWSFSTELPGGETYRSDTQIELRPNERAEFTMGFGIDAQSNRTVKVTTTVNERTDINNSNNSFTWAVGVEK